MSPTGQRVIALLVVVSVTTAARFFGMRPVPEEFSAAAVGLLLVGAASGWILCSLQVKEGK